LGETVTVRGQYKQEISEVGFTITEEDIFGDDNVLVLNATGEPFNLSNEENEEIQILVRGDVARLVFADLEREYSLDLDPNLYVDYEGEPVLIANSLALSPEPEEITENTEQFLGKQVTIVGEAEDEVAGDNTYTFDDLLTGGEYKSRTTHQC
jgi:hypothetical protein